MLVNKVVLREALLSAFKQLSVQPLRTFLTISGISIGIAALIAMMGIGEGTRQKVINDMEKIGGTGVITVELQNMGNNDPNRQNIQKEKLTKKDLTAFEQASNLITGIAPVVHLPGLVFYNDLRFEGQALATTEFYSEIRDWPVEKGRFLTRVDLDYLNNVCVIGSEVKQKLFADDDPIGRKVRFRGEEFSVVGIMAKRNFEAGRWLNDLILLPITTVEKRITGQLDYSSILLKTDKMDTVPLVKDQISLALNNRHPNPGNIVIHSQVDVINSLNRASMLMRFSFGSITLIVLMVGGIGIMNLMLVSVTERTREVGIHKAVGAQDHDILLLFLFEAMTLSLLGGIIGIFFGIQGGNFLSFAIAVYLDNQVACIISNKSIMLAVFFSVFIGIVFGLYPAMKAASIDPSKALSYE
ncbi:MAG: ABC transporter permease [Proteobacteria bacterium]|nr:ABC transporter permease [Pseudomonadota bacterium]MBU1715673.1 ABC transporter permease [Pseudomonadota bacterium]